MTHTSKCITTILLLLTLLSTPLITPPPTYAASQMSCNIGNGTLTFSVNPPEFIVGTLPETITFTVTDIPQTLNDDGYHINFSGPGFSSEKHAGVTVGTSFTVVPKIGAVDAGTHTVQFKQGGTVICELGTYSFTDKPAQHCTAIRTDPVRLSHNTFFSVIAEGLDPNAGYSIDINGKTYATAGVRADGNGTVKYDISNKDVGFYTINIVWKGSEVVCTININVCIEAASCDPPTQPSNPGGGGPAATFHLCKQAGDVQECTDCLKAKGVWTAFGCWHYQTVPFVKDFLTITLGLSGGLAFLLMLVSIIQISSASGNPEAIQKGRERFTSAVAGLILIIFSVIILNVIGVQLFHIPGF